MLKKERQSDAMCYNFFKQENFFMKLSLNSKHNIAKQESTVKKNQDKRNFFKNLIVWK